MEKILNIKGMETDSDSVTIETDKKFITFYHSQDCCENVRVEQVDFGKKSIEDYIGSNFLGYEEKTNINEPYSGGESYTWTFYTIKTSRGYIDFRWLGESNGYYSESVDVKEILK